MPIADKVASQVRLLPPSDPLRNSALAFALETPDSTSRSSVARFVSDSDRRGLNIEVLCGVSRGDEITFACLLVESPGRAALLVIPWSRFSEGDSATAWRAIRIAVDEALSRNAALIQTLVPHSTPQISAQLSRVGFRKLTQLIYLRRRTASERRESGAELEWTHYAPEHETTFVRTLESSYGESLDCPELCGLRTTQEVLAGHRATGDFDPSLWFVAILRGEPVGILLLSEIPATESIEVVYMGVAQAARGKGVGDALLGQALAAARDRRAKFLALAVDSRNEPARRLYERWDFVELMRRDAWIATSAIT